MPPVGEGGLDPFARLLRGLALEETGRDVFQGRTGKDPERLYGGLLLAQAAVAAGRTVGGDRRLHSLHGYFLRPGRSRLSLELMVERLRDGTTFSARRIVVRQAGDAALVAAASFVGSGQGISHQDLMPPAPEPEGLPNWEDLRAAALRDPSARRENVAVEVRVCDPDALDTGASLPPYRRVWIRLRGELPDDPLLHAAALVFASDRTLLRVGARPHGVGWRMRHAASLDHAIWLHHQPRFDGWLLYVCESPAAEAGRVLALGAFYSRDGTRVASVAQEGLLRF